MHSRRSFLGLVGASALVVSAPGVASAALRPRTASATVDGPITGGTRGYPFGAYFGNIGDVGYVEEEYFLSGTAGYYAPQSPLTADGKWTMAVAGSAPYKTRFLVRRPADPRRFNGTVVVEWANVSFGYDVAPLDLTGLYQDGYIYVSVSAQKVGVSGDPAAPQQYGLQQWDPQRYRSLDIPDDAYSYDIVSQVVNVLRTAPPRVLGGQVPRRVVGAGWSQSGSRVLSYVNGVQPLSCSLDAALLLLNAGASSAFGPGVPRSQVFFTQVRPDSRIPVFAMSSESEALYYHQLAIQPDTDRFRYWEIAGASHENTRVMAGIWQKTDRDGVPRAGTSPTPASEVDWTPTADAAFHHIDRWVRTNQAPPTQNLLQISANQYVRDQYGNALGGVRLPELEVPVATYVGNAGPGGLPGTTTPFTTAQLTALYPSHADYVAKVTAAASTALAAGVILPYRVDEYANAAKASPWP